MKAVLLSIKPKWCRLIAEGKKTVEVRKTKPKIDGPFKCYIYCTSSNVRECLLQNENGVKLIHAINYKTAIPCGGHIGNGKVIGEFVCNRVQSFESEFVDDDCYESIASLDYDEDGDATGFIEWSNDSDFSYESTDFYKKCCVKYEELKKYMGYGINQFYAWHLSNLIIYEQPKELKEFWQSGGTFNSKRDNIDDIKIIGTEAYKPLTRPPQSWCYVEEQGGNK